MKEDLNCSPAEMVYPSPLTLLFELVCPSDDRPTSGNRTFPEAVRAQMATLRRPTVPQRAANSFVQRDLADCSHVFVRVDATRRPLEPNYRDPYLVLRRKTHAITSSRDGREDEVDVDRVKAALLETSTTPSRGQLPATDPVPQGNSVGPHSDPSSETPAGLLRATPWWAQAPTA